VINLLLMGLLLDAIFQWVILGVSHAGAALIVGPGLIVTPYALARSLANRSSGSGGGAGHQPAVSDRYRPSPGRTRMDSRRGAAAALTALLLTGGVSMARAEDRAVRAGTSWHARVRIFVTGSQQMFLLGVFGGRFAVESGPRTLDGAALVCPAAFDADYTAKSQHGEGRCVLTTGAGDRVFARWTCGGEPDQGCTGRFTLTGGTGAFQGVTGEGDVVIKMVVSSLLQFEQQEAEYELSGLASWPALTYRTP